MINKPYEENFCSKCFYRENDKCTAYVKKFDRTLYCGQVVNCEYFLTYEEATNKLAEKLKRRK